MDNLSIKFFILGESMGRIIVVASGKGGVGKTTITANLGIVLAGLNHSVCLVDGDLGLNNLDVMLGLENRVVYDIMDVLQGKCRLSQGLVKDPIYSNLYMLASTKTECCKNISMADFKSVVLELERVFDYVLIDAPAGIDYGFERAVLSAGEVLLVVTPSVASLRDTGKAILKIQGMQKKDLKIVVNRNKWGMVKRGELLGFDDIENLLGEKVVGVISENDLLSAGYSLKTLAEKEPELYSEFKILVENVAGYKNYSLQAINRGLFSGVKKLSKGRLK